MSNALVVTDEETGRKLAVLADPAVSEYAVLTRSHAHPSTEDDHRLRS